MEPTYLPLVRKSKIPLFIETIETKYSKRSGFDTHKHYDDGLIASLFQTSDESKHENFSLAQLF